MLFLRTGFIPISSSGYDGCIVVVDMIAAVSFLGYFVSILLLLGVVSVFTITEWNYDL